MKNLLKLGIQLTGKQQQEIIGGLGFADASGPSTCESRCKSACDHDPFNPTQCKADCEALC